LDISLGIKKSGIVFACSKTFCKNDFVKLLAEYSNKMKLMLIGDEAHGLGATETSKGLVELYNLRLGLSATPSRWFDDYGTELIRRFFGKESFEFTIYQALHTERPGTGKAYLTPYVYEPVFITLSEAEVFDYEEKSKKIMKVGRMKEKDEDARLRYERLLMARANIYKNAENKYAALKQIIDDIKDDIDDTIIFVSDEQIDEVVDMLSRMKIRCVKYTQERGTRPLRKYRGKTEREYVIEEFKNHTFQVLVAIKCLDEGIDIPSARRAIIMASSTNPREFIQRVGRVIRTAEGKELATIYDLIVVPDVKTMDSDLRKFELQIFEKEQNRIFDISNNAENSATVIKKVDHELRRLHKWN
jgi:superfamily II DNA or RNA helicase